MKIQILNEYNRGKGLKKKKKKYNGEKEKETKTCMNEVTLFIEFIFLSFVLLSSPLSSGYLIHAISIFLIKML